MLIVFGGLPGTGKTTIARQVAERCQAVYLRVDVIEQAIRNAGVLAGDVGPAGYMAAYGVAQSNLNLGRRVVADSVNPLAVTRQAWRAVAAAAGAGVIEVEIICSDPQEHRRRVESRASDIPGLTPPCWTAVAERNYEPWMAPHIVIDTAVVTAAEAASGILSAIEAEKTRRPAAQ